MALKIPYFAGNILTVDPGTKYCGWAYWRPKADSYGQEKRGFNLDRHGLISAEGHDGTAYDRANWIAATIMKSYIANSRLLVIEQPRQYGGSTGKGAAARNSDAILKLMYLVGVLAGRAMQAGVVVALVPVQNWKGNAPKSVTARRVERAWAVKTAGLRSDEVDAIGLGDWLIRKHWNVRQ